MVKAEEIFWSIDYQETVLSGGARVFGDPQSVIAEADSITGSRPDEPAIQPGGRRELAFPGIRLGPRQRVALELDARLESSGSAGSRYVMQILVNDTPVGHHPAASSSSAGRRTAPARRVDGRLPGSQA